MNVNEIFGPTIQGEGESAGMLTMFARLGDCNLACGFCDTPHAFNWFGTPFKHPEKYDRKKETHEMSCKEILARLKKMGLGKVKALVITGGEPMIQQDEIIELLRLLRRPNPWLGLFYRFKLVKPTRYWVEIETNGTFEPKDEFLELIDQINCSPKTSNSGSDNRPAMRERPKALRKLAASSKTFFKFVVKDRSDLSEITDLVSKYSMKNVCLMAEGRSRKEQYALAPEVMKICREYDFNFSHRWHVLYWDRKRGV